MTSKINGTALNGLAATTLRDRAIDDPLAYMRHQGILMLTPPLRPAPAARSC